MGKKQDRPFTRTAAQLERKLQVKKNLNKVSVEMSETERLLENTRAALGELEKFETEINKNVALIARKVEDINKDLGNAFGFEEGKLTVKPATAEISGALLMSGTVLRSTGLLNAVYPIGSVYLSYGQVSPEELLGGSWERVGEGLLRSCLPEESVGQGGIVAIAEPETGIGVSYINITAWYRVT